MIPYIVLTVGICIIVMGAILWIKENTLCTLFDGNYTWAVLGVFGLSLVVHALISMSCGA
ncbi:MAG: hypothetical protein IK038_03235 [Bacteroidaceae bacterium]|nr:hypothetical protein [Bacteroidaceae bacterium]